MISQGFILIHYTQLADGLQSDKSCQEQFYVLLTNKAVSNNHQQDFGKT